MRPVLTQALATDFSRIALGHVSREYPNNPDHAMSGPDEATKTPSELHPIFYGSYDWHSCVHSYWMLAHLLRRFPAMETAEDIRALFARQFVAEKVAVECAYFARPVARTFKRPYGWAWLLKLAEELIRHHDQPWADTLAPLAEVIAQRFRDFLPLAIYPMRVGTHFNTAFGLRMAMDYADATRDTALAAQLRDAGQRWYGDDAACPAWGEPSLDEFQSQALIEAECMRRLLPVEDFRVWFDRFLPALEKQQPATLFRPASVSDRTDGKIAHLDGLNLSRAWCWRAIASALPEDDARRALIERSAQEHLTAALPHLASHYMGEHWLASFAVLALEA